MIELKDSGTRSEFVTGAVRDGAVGKGRMDLLPPDALIEISKVFEAGAAKYQPNNWRKGIPLSRFMDSGLRHAMRWARGDNDEPHLAMACWNFICLLDTVIRIEKGELPFDLNDLPDAPVRMPRPTDQLDGLEEIAKWINDREQRERERKARDGVIGGEPLVTMFEGYDPDKLEPAVYSAAPPPSTASGQRALAEPLTPAQIAAIHDDF